MKIFVFGPQNSGKSCYIQDRAIVYVRSLVSANPKRVIRIGQSALLMTVAEQIRCIFPNNVRLFTVQERGMNQNADLLLIDSTTRFLWDRTSYRYGNDAIRYEMEQTRMYIEMTQEDVRELSERLMGHPKHTIVEIV